MVRTAADRWKGLRRKPVILLEAAAAQPFDNGSLLGRAAVFRAKRAKRHKVDKDAQRATLKDAPPGRLMPFREGTCTTIVKRKLDVPAAPKAGSSDIAKLIREPMGPDGSLESNWNTRRIGALLAKSAALNDEYAVCRAKVFNPLPTSQDQADAASPNGLRVNGLVCRSIVALDHLGDASSLRTEGLLRLEGPLLQKKPKPVVPRLHLDRVERDSLRGFMPQYRVGAIAERVEGLRESIRSRDKDWRLVSWRDHLVLKAGDGVKRCIPKKRGYVRDGFWGGQEPSFVPELRRRCSHTVLEVRASIVSRTRGRLSVVGVGFAGTVFEVKRDEDPSTRLIKVQMQSMDNSLSWYQMDRKGLLHIFSQRSDREHLLVPGNRPKLINALIEHSYFVYALIECWWDGPPPLGWGHASAFGEHNNVEKTSASLAGTRTIYREHLEPWGAQPVLVAKKGPSLDEAYKVHRESPSKKKFKASATLLSKLRHVLSDEAPSPSRPSSAARAGPPEAFVTAPAPAPARRRPAPSVAPPAPARRKSTKREPWRGGYTVRVCSMLRVGPERRVHLDAMRHVERARQLEREDAIRAYEAARWALTPKRYRGCLVACGAYVKGESCMVRVYDIPALQYKICTVKVTHCRTGLEYACRVPFTDLATWTKLDASADEDDVDARKQLARRIPALLSFCSENELSAKAHAENLRRCQQRGTSPAPQTFVAGPGLEVLRIGPWSVPLDADCLPGKNVLARHATKLPQQIPRLNSGLAGVNRMQNYGPGLRYALPSNDATPSSPHERGSYRLLKTRPPVRALTMELLCRGASQIEGRRCRFEAFRKLDGSYELRMLFSVRETYTLVLRKGAVTRACKASDSAGFVHAAVEEAVLDARIASITAEGACLDDHDDLQASEANVAATMAQSVADRFKKKRKKKKGRGPPKIGMARDEKRACQSVAKASRRLETRSLHTFGEYVGDLVLQLVDDALQQPQRVVAEVLRTAVRTVACAVSADDAERYVRASCVQCWADTCRALLEDIRFVPDLPIMEERERAVAYSVIDHFETATLALAKAARDALEVKQDARRKADLGAFVPCHKLEPWLRTEMHIPKAMKKRLVSQEEGEAFLERVKLTGRKQRDHFADVFDAKNARLLLKRILKKDWAAPPKKRLRLEARLWRGVRKLRCVGVAMAHTPHISVLVTINWCDESIDILLEEMETCEEIELKLHPSILQDLGDQIDNIELVDGRYDLTINVFLRALIVEEVASKRVAELDEESGWAVARALGDSEEFSEDDADFGDFSDDDAPPTEPGDDAGGVMAAQSPTRTVASRGGATVLTPA